MKSRSQFFIVYNVRERVMSARNPNRNVIVESKRPI